MKLNNLIGIILLILVVSFIFAVASGNKDSRNAVNATVDIQENFSYKPSHPDAEQIPDEVYRNTMGHDNFYDVIDPKGTTKHIFWAYADCPIGRGLKDSINSTLEINGLTSYYIHNGNLMAGGLMVTCHNSSTKCAEPYLYDNCSDDICIINPQKKELIKIPNNDNVLIENKLILLKDW